MIEQRAHVVQAGLRDPRSLQHLCGLVDGEWGKGRRKESVDCRPVGVARHVRAETFVARQLGLPQYIAAETLPFTLVLDSKHDLPAVTARHRSVRVDTVVAHAGAWRLRPTVTRKEGRGR